MGEGPTLALASPPVVAGELVTPLRPQSFLVLGDGTQGLSLEGGNASLLRILPLLLGQVIPKVSFVARDTVREHSLLLSGWGAWKLFNDPKLILLELPCSLLPVLLPCISARKADYRRG